MNDLLNKFEQNLAESMNEASQESALDMMKRVEALALEIDKIICNYQKHLPDVVIDGVLMYHIVHRGVRNYHIAEAVIQAEKLSE